MGAYWSGNFGSPQLINLNNGVAWCERKGQSFLIPTHIKMPLSLLFDNWTFRDINDLLLKGPSDIKSRYIKLDINSQKHSYDFKPLKIALLIFIQRYE